MSFAPKPSSLAVCEVVGGGNTGYHNVTSPAAAVRKAGLQYSFSPACVSTHTRLSAMRSSTTAWARGLSQLRFSCSMDTVT